MPIANDAKQALNILERIQRNVEGTDAMRPGSQASEDLHSLINVLNNPVFKGILNIQDSLIELKHQLHKHPSILPVDFDIKGTGELILNVPSVVTTPTVRTDDPFDADYGVESVQNFEFDNLSGKSDGKHTPLSDKLGRSPILSQKSKEDDDESEISRFQSHSSIGGYCYTVEFQQALEEAAQGREVLNIQLYKPEGSSLGFSVVGLKSEQRGELGIFIQEIQQHGVASKDGRLQEGDQILAIDGQLLDRNISHQQAIGILQQVRGLVELAVARGGILPSDSSPPASLDRSPSAVSVSSKASDMLNTEWAQVEVIDLINEGPGLGFGIIGGRSTGVVVKTIIPGDVADKDGRLRSGDHILRIGDVNLKGMGSDQVAAVLRQSGRYVRLVVARPFEPSSPDYQMHANIHSNAPIVPTRILNDPEELDRHLMLIASQNGFVDPSVYSNLEVYGQHFIFDQTSGEPVGEADIELHAPLEMEAAMAGLDETVVNQETFDVELTKGQQGLGITIAGYVCEKGSGSDDEISGIFVKNITPGSAAHLDGRIQLNDQIVEVDGRSLRGYTNHEAVEVLRNTGKVVCLRLVRYLRGPKYEQLQQAIAASNDLVPTTSASDSILPVSHSFSGAATYLADVTDAITDGVVSLEELEAQIDDNYDAPFLDPAVERAIQLKWSKIMGSDFTIIVAQLSKFQGGELGISLEGTVDIEDGQEVRPHHYIRSILPNGPVGLNGQLRSGDELLEVNGRKLYGLNHKDVVRILKELPIYVRMVCGRSNESSVQWDSTVSDLAPYDMSMIPRPGPLGSSGAATYGGSLQNLMPVPDRLFKAKSDGSLAAATSSCNAETSFSKMRSRSLEPLTGLAMWSSDPQIIELVKGDRGLGFSILDYQDPMNPEETVIVIRSLVPGGVAQQDGRLIPGDRLMFVNDINLENASLDEAVQALKGACKGVVRIGVAKPLPLPDSAQSSGLKWSPELKPEPPASSSEPENIEDIQMPSNERVLTLATEESTTGSERSTPAPSPCMSPMPSSPGGSRWRGVPPLPAALERTIKLKKGSDSLGLELEVVEKGINGAIVRRIVPNGVVHKDGRLQVGDYVLSVNNESMRRITNSQCRSIMRRTQLISTDVSITYIPWGDVAVYKESALMQMRDEAESNTVSTPTQVRQMSPSSPLFPGTPDETDGSDSAPPTPPSTRRSPLTPWKFRETAVYGSSLDVNPADVSDDEDENDESSVTVLAKPTELSAERLLRTAAINESQISSGLSNVELHSTDLDEPNVRVTERPKSVEVPPSEISRSVCDLTEYSASTVVNRRQGSGSHFDGFVVDVTRTPSPTKTLSLTSETMPTPGTSPTTPMSAAIAVAHGRTVINAKAWGPERVVELWREPNRSLGISIVGGKVDLFHMSSTNTITGIFIKNVLPDSPAGKNGTMKTGDRILEVDGVDLRDATHEKAVEVIKKSKNPVRFVLQSLVQSPKESEESSSTSISPKTPCDQLGTSIGHNFLSPMDAITAMVSKTESNSDLSEVDSQSYVTTGRRESFNVLKEAELDMQTQTNFDKTDDEQELENIERLDEAAEMVTSEDHETEQRLKKIRKKFGDLKGEFLVIDIPKGPNGLGLSLAGNKDRTKMNTFIVGLCPSGNAFRDGRIQVGDEILEVNGQVLHGRCHLNASAIIKGLSGSIVGMVLLRRKEALNEMAVKPITQFPVKLGDESSADKLAKFKSARVVSLKKGPQGLGIMIMEGTHAEAGQGVFISDMQPGSCAEIAGLVVGDMILRVNDEELLGADYETVASTLKKAEGNIRLLVYDPNRPADEKAETDKFDENSDDPSCDPATCEIKPGQETTIEISKEKMGLGLSIVGGSDTLLGSIIIHEIYPDGAAAKDGRLRPGDQILEVNLENFRGVTHDLAIQMLRQTPSKVKLVVYREEHANEDDIYDVFELEITKKPGKGLGLSIVGRKNGTGVYISDVVKGGVAEADGRLMQGDQILMVNGRDLKNATQEEAAALLKTTMGTIHMKIGRLKAVSRRSSTGDISPKPNGKSDG
ncbi:hypothetical protein CHUAL_012941 [Chamberlinius hualienensis]